MNHNNFNYRALLEKVNELQKDAAINVLSTWMEGWKKLSDVDAQFTRFVDSPNHGANMAGGIFEQVWFYLVWNFFRKEQINSNGLVKELYEIMNSVNEQTFSYLSGGFNKDNLKKLVLDLYGNVNVIYGSIIKKDYATAAKKAQLVFDKFMNQPGFTNVNKSMFNEEGKTRMKTFINMLSSPTIAATTASAPAETGSTATAATRKSVARRSEPQEDMAKIKANVSKLID